MAQLTRVRVCRFVHRPAWRPEVINWLREEGGLSSTLWPWELCRFGLCPIRQLKSSYLGLTGAPQPTCPPSFHPADLGWLGSWQLLQWWGKLGSSLPHCFPELRVPVFCLLPLPGPQVSLHLWTPSLLCCVLRPFLAEQLTYNTLAFYRIRSFPFLPTAPSDTQEYVKSTI